MWSDVFLFLHNTAISPTSSSKAHSSTIVYRINPAAVGNTPPTPLSAASNIPQPPAQSQSPPQETSPEKVTEDGGVDAPPCLEVVEGTLVKVGAEEGVRHRRRYGYGRGGCGCWCLVLLRAALETRGHHSRGGSCPCLFLRQMLGGWVHAGIVCTHTPQTPRPATSSSTTQPHGAFRGVHGPPLPLEPLVARNCILRLMGNGGGDGVARSSGAPRGYRGRFGGSTPRTHPNCSP